MILSLIRLQADRITDQRLLTAFEETQARVRTIAAVHERLYASPDFATIHVEPYLRALVYDVQSSYDAGGRINVQMDIADLALEIDDAVPLGLITNELLCNAFQTCFPRRPPGYRDDEGKLRPPRTVKTSHVQRAQLEIRDNGVGLPADFQLENQDDPRVRSDAYSCPAAPGEVLADKAASGACFEVLFPLARGDEFCAKL